MIKAERKPVTFHELPLSSRHIQKFETQDGSVDQKEEWLTEDSKYHRIEGPALVDVDGKKSWFIDGIEFSKEEFEELSFQVKPGVFKNHKSQLHREDGPAIKYASGTKEWWHQGQLHRTDGPAVEYSDGIKEWYLNGEKLTEKEFNKVVDEKKSSLVVSITKGLLGCFFWAIATNSFDKLEQLESLKQQVISVEQEEEFFQQESVRTQEALTC